MKKIKKFISLLLMSALMITVVAGCGEKPEPADVVAKAYYATIINNDSSKMQELGAPKDEVDKIMKEMRDTLETTTKNNFYSGGLLITDEEVSQLVDAQYAAMKKASADITVKSSDDKTSEVVIKTHCIELKDIDTKAAEDAVSEVQAMNLTDGTKMKEELSKKYIANIVKGLNDAQPTSNTKELEVKFSMQTVNMGNKTKKMWQPDQPAQFGRDLMLTVTNAQ